MKLKYLSMFAAAALVAFASCSDDNNGPSGDDQGADEAANIDYTDANAASWANYMVQVSTLLRNDASSLYDAWTVSYNGGRPFAEVFRTHSGGDYSSAKSCIEQIIDGCVDIASEVGTSKIGEPYNLWKSGQTTKALYAVESWYSWHSREDYSNNILSIRNSYYGSLDGSVASASIAELVKTLDPDLDKKLRDQIAGTSAAILAIPQPFRNNIASQEALDAMDECATLEELLSVDLKRLVGTLADNDSRLQDITDNYVDVVVLPTYAALKTRNAELHQAVLNFKANPSDNTFAAACNAWLVAREPWETSEAFLFGPVDALGLDPNMDSWPLDQNAIVQILNSGNYDNLNWSDTDSDDKIEAVQSVRGFHTLEFLLFKDGQPRKVK